jgi:hypothetical protein
MPPPPPVRALLVIEGNKVEAEFTADSAKRVLRALAIGRDARLRQLERAVRGYRREHPDAPANELVRVIGGNRRDVLAADRVVTGRSARESTRGLPGRESLVPPPENHAREAKTNGEVGES